MDRLNKKKHPVPLVGITGGIGSGKSLLAGMFRQSGAFVIDADKIGKEVLEQDREISANVVGHFGEKILNCDKDVDRNKLANIVFNDSKELEKLNAIIHPQMIGIIEKKVKAALELKQNPMIVVDAALIFEAKVEDRFDYIINISSAIEHQIKRLTERNGISEEEIIHRIKSQMAPEIKKNKSHYNVDNDGTIEELKIKANKLFSDILEDFNRKCE